MKKFLFMLLAGFIGLNATAQDITLTFNGTNANRNYHVILDDVSYYSNSAIDAGANTSVRKEITISNQPLGTHRIAVYRQRPNSGNVNNGTSTPTYGRAIYSNTFQLREGYDMNISINGAGQVRFSEKRIRADRPNRGNQGISAMTDESFNQLLVSVRNNYTQATRVTAIREAFNTTNNYFTTEQVRQLLLLINAEANRLTLAKLGYPKVTDPANFTDLYTVFARVASRNDMDVFIRNNPNTNGNSTSGNNNNNTRTAMADYQFSQLLRTAGAQYNQTTRFNTIRNAINVRTNYFTTSQLRQLLNIVDAESNRLLLAKAAYLKVTDPTSFTTLYDLLYTQASRTDLNNYIIQNGGVGSTQPVRTPMADDAFTTLYKEAADHFLPWNRINDVKDAFNNTAYNFSTAQIIKLLNIVSSEMDRLPLAKLAWARVSDPTNFAQVYTLFSSPMYRDDLKAYVLQNGGVNNTNDNTYRTAMADYQFSQLLQNANAQYNQTTRFNTIRNAINTSANYFSTSQVRQLLSTIDAEGNRLILAKAAYLKVTDPSSFTTLYDLFMLQSSRTDLNNFVVQNGGTGSNQTYSNRIPMAEQAFSQLLQSAGNHILPWNKFNDVRDAFNNTSYYFTTAQIRQLLNIISGENDKLALAKLAWSRVSDPGNFTQLFDLFTTQSYRDDLNAYIVARPI